MRSILAALALGLSLSFAPLPADALEAEALKAEVEDLLGRARSFLAPVAIEGGTVSVEPEGTGVRLTVSDLAVFDPAEGRRFEIGTLSALVTEPGPGLYGFDELQVPRRMVVTEGAAEIGSVALDLERFSGVYSIPVQDFLQLDFLARSFELRIPSEKVLVGSGRMVAWIATVAEHDHGIATGYQRQRQYASLERLVMSGEDGTLEIGSIIGDGSADGLDLRLYETLMAVIADLETAAAQGNESRIAALRSAVAEAAAIAESFGGGFRMSDLEHFDEFGRRTFQLETLRLAIGLETPRNAEFGAASLTLSGSGLSVDAGSMPEAEPYLDLIPHSWSIPLALEHVPLQPLAQSIADLIVASAGDPLKGDEQLVDIGNALLSALGSAGSYLIVRDLFMEAPLVRLDSKASLAFSPSVDLGMVGNIAFTLTGLDRVLAVAERMTDADAKRMLSAAVLAMMGVGQAVALPDGRVGYRFSFFFAPDGAVTMNGFAFGDLMNKAIPQ